MSIINDALKKVQISLKKKESEKSPTASEKQKEEAVSSNTEKMQSPKRTEIHDVPQASAAPTPEPKKEAQKIQPQPSLSSPAFSKMSASNKNNIQNILLFLFCFSICVFFFALAGYLIKQIAKPAKDKTPAAQATIPQRQVEAIKKRTLPLTKPKTIGKKIVIEKNPLEDIAIYGIMTMDEKYVALINNEIYEVGDQINGMKIMDISLNHVKFLDGKQIRTLEVPK